MDDSLGQARRNMIASGVFLVVSIFLIAYAIPAQITVKGGLLQQGGSIESRVFPYFASAIMGLAAFVELCISSVRYVRWRKQERNNERQKPNVRMELRALAIFALCIVYALLFAKIGYLLSTLIVTPAALFVMGGRKWQHYVSVLVIGAIMYGIFQYVLHVPLP